MKHPRPKPSPPSKDELVAFIAEHGGKAGMREIARAFGMKNADRTLLRHMLRELAEDGRIERRRKKVHRAGTLPDVVLADVCARDTDGELIAIPTDWDEAERGPAPKIHVRAMRRARPSEVAGVGDRALLIDPLAARGSQLRVRGPGRAGCGRGLSSSRHRGAPVTAIDPPDPVNPRVGCE